MGLFQRLFDPVPGVERRAEKREADQKDLHRAAQTLVQMAASHAETGIRIARIQGTVRVLVARSKVE